MTTGHPGAPVSGPANPTIDLKGDKATNRTPTLAGAPTKLMVAEIRDDSGNIVGHKLISNVIKFDWEAKEIVIRELADHGRLGAAARAAGVTTDTVRRHVKADAEFAVAVGEAIEVYKDKLIAHHQRLVFEGEEKRTYDREGNLISVEQKFPVRLIELELKKHDPGYREKQEHVHEHRGGVMVAPKEVKDVDEWEAKFGHGDQREQAEDAEIVEGED